MRQRILIGMTDNIQAIFWDLGGVIVRTEDRSKRESWEKRFDMQPRELDRLIFAGEMGRRAALGQASADEVWDWTRDQLALDVEEGRQLQEDFWQGDDVDLSLVGYIRGLKSTYQTGLISNAWLELRELIEDHWQIDDAFDDLVISAEVGLAKPDPRIYELALERLHVPADRAVFVDDFEANAAAAAALGMHAIRFKDPVQARAELDRLLV